MARTAHEAAENFKETIREILSCISSDGLLSSPPGKPGAPRVLRTMGGPSPLMQDGGGRIYLHVSHEYRVLQEAPSSYRVTTTAYIYTIMENADRSSRMLGFHYHPAGGVDDEGVTTPHLHVYSSVEMGSRTLGKLHLPTDRVALEDVVWLLIRDFRVRLRRHKDTDAAHAFLTERRGAFEAARRWPQSGGPATAPQ